MQTWQKELRWENRSEESEARRFRQEIEGEPRPKPAPDTYFGECVVCGRWTELPSKDAVTCSPLRAGSRIVELLGIAACVTTPPPP
jgi:hypothetical protein